MQWTNEDMGELQVSLEELHDLVAKRTFTHEGQQIFKVVPPEDLGDLPAGPGILPINELFARANEMLEAINDFDCEFHDHYEAYCTGVEQFLDEEPTVKDLVRESEWDAGNFLDSDEGVDSDADEDDDDGDE